MLHKVKIKWQNNNEVKFKNIYRFSHKKVYNRAYYDEQAKGILSQYDGVMMFDVDKFKMINDTYGHLAGDAVKQINIENYPDIDLSISIGSIYCQKQPQKSLIENLDKLLYKAKHDKESICFELYGDCKEGHVE